MDNHHHLLLRTPDANLSDAIRWLQISYGSAFNWAHRIHGPLFQGCFRSILLEHSHAVVEVARSLHLNPVRIGGLVFGSKEFASRWLMPAGASGAEQEPKTWKSRDLRPEWGSIVRAAETISGRPWSEAVDLHGLWVRDAVLYTAVRHLGYRLAEVQRVMAGLKYAAAAQAVKRFGLLLPEDPGRQAFVRRLRQVLGGSPAAAERSRAPAPGSKRSCLSNLDT